MHGGTQSMAEPVDVAAPSADRATAARPWAERHAVAIDVVVLLGVFAYNLPIQLGQLPEGMSAAVGIAVSIGLCAPYLARRRRPVATVVAIQVVATVQLALGIGLIVADVVLALAIGSLAARRTWPVPTIAAGVAIAWLVAAVVPRMDEDGTSAVDVVLLAGVVAWAWTWGQLVRARRERVESLRQRTVQLEREQRLHAELAIVRERARIARELHDGVAHGLSAVAVLADAAASIVGIDDDRARSTMIAARDTGRSALVDMRRMLGLLRNGDVGSDAPQPGIDNIPQLVADVAAAGMPVVLRVVGGPATVPGDVGLAAYRIVQEALTNVRKHAGDVRSVRVRVEHRSAEVVVRVADDGIGRASVDDSLAEAGFGILGMRERVAWLGGVLTASPADAGFVVEARLPIPTPSTASAPSQEPAA